MEWLKIKPEPDIKINKYNIERKKPIPLDISPSEIIIKIRKKEVNQREKEIDNYMKDLEYLMNEINKLNYSIQRVKSMTELASIREKILTESCKF